MRLVLRRWLIRSLPSRSRPRGSVRESTSSRRSCTPSTMCSSSTTPGRIRANPRRCREPGSRQLTAHRYYSRDCTRKFNWTSFLWAKLVNLFLIFYLKIWQFLKRILILKKMTCWFCLMVLVLSYQVLMGSQ